VDQERYQLKQPPWQKVYHPFDYDWHHYAVQVCTIHASGIKWWQSMAIASIQYSAKIVVGIELTIWTTDQSDKNQAAELFEEPVTTLVSVVG
jgi:hypothetical protein